MNAYQEFIDNYFKAIDQYKENLRVILNFNQNYKTFDGDDFYKAINSYAYDKEKFVVNTINNAGSIVPEFLSKLMLYINYCAKCKSLVQQLKKFSEIKGTYNECLVALKSEINEISENISDLILIKKSMCYKELNDSNTICPGEDLFELRERLAKSTEKEAKLKIKYIDKLAESRFSNKELLSQLNYLIQQFEQLKSYYKLVKSDINRQKRILSDKHNITHDLFVSAKSNVQKTFYELSDLLYGYETPLLAAIYFGLSNAKGYEIKVKSVEMRRKDELSHAIKTFLIDLRY